MATRKKPDPGRLVPGLQLNSSFRQISAILGVVLIGVAVLWFLWLAARQADPGLGSMNFSFSGVFNHNPNTSSTPDPLVAAGITLEQPSDNPQPLIGRQQAVLLADQMQPGVAARAGTISVQYVLLSYSNSNTSTLTFQRTPAWVVHYTKVTEPHPDTAADPQASTTQHDCYVFLDANSGKELLAIWL